MNAKPGQLKLQWGSIERGEPKDVCYVWGDGCSSRDSRLLHWIFCCAKTTFGEPEKSFVEQLKERGYDISTIRFSIQKRKEVI